MTKKDYELIAHILGDNQKLFKDYASWRHFAGYVVPTELANKNPKFDRDKFVQSCGVETEKPKTKNDSLYWA